MDVLLVFFLLSVALFGLAFVQSKLAKIFLLVFGAMWVGSSCLSINNPFGLYNVSTYANFLIITGMAMILIGYSLYQPRKSKNYTNTINICESIDKLCNLRKIKYTFYLCLGIIIYLAVTQWQLIILQAGLGNLKLDFFELVFDNNHLLFFIYQVLMCPLFYLTSVLLSYLIIEKKWSLKTLLLGVYVLFFCFVGGKRGYYSIVFLYFFVCFLIYKFARFNRGGHKKLPIKAFLIIGVIVGFGASMITAVGSGGTEADKDEVSNAASKLSQGIFIYSIGSYRAFDRAVSHDYVAANGGYLYGRATLGGAVDYYGTAILNVMGIPVKSARAVAMAPVQNNSIRIGKEREWNFSYTAFYYFWFDAGIIGIVLFSFLFGLFVRFSIGLFENTGTIGSMALVCYMFQSCNLITGSWINIQLYTQPAILIFYYLHRMEIIKRKNEISKEAQNIIQYN